MNNNIIIKKLSEQEIDNTFKIYKDATENLISLGINQWDDFYPTKEIILNDIKKESLFGYFEKNTICAAMVLNTEQSPEYSNIDWKFKDKHPLVLHRICVSPKHQRKGIAKKLIIFMEEYAIKNNYKTIRFDTFTKNPYSVKLYNSLGFINSGTVKFRKGEFYCFEKRILS
ncbi:MAG: GNAT family N-acetyltransferase [Spirochaetales bacterium]|nr:GNAT family N-acetyltransferase [Spirochaetales bacterium]